MPSQSKLDSRYHEDAIYPTTKLSMNFTRQKHPERHFQQEPAEQEARTTFPHGFIIVGPNLPVGQRQKSEYRSCFALSRQLATDFVPPRSIQVQGAEYRARSAGRQLGAKILESCVEPCQNRPSKTSSSATILLRKPTIPTLNQAEKGCQKNLLAAREITAGRGLFHQQNGQKPGSPRGFPAWAEP